MSRNIFRNVVAAMAIATTQSASAGCQSDCAWEYAVNPPLVYADRCECNWSGHLDYLYWKPYEDGLNFGSTEHLTTRDVQNTDNYTFDFNTNKVDFDWDSGFRVGLGYGFPCDCWEISLDWTHFRTDTAKFFNAASTSSTNPSALDVTFINPPFVDSVYSTDSIISADEQDLATTLGGKWSIQLNQLDLEFARTYQVGPCVYVRPHINISTLVIQQKLGSYFTAEFNPADAPVRGSLVLNSDITCQFKGVGIGTGLDSYYQFSCGLGFYGDWKISCFYGTFEQSHRLLQSFRKDTGSGNTTADYYVHDRLTALRTVNDLGLGLMWISRFNCERNVFTFKAGWEHHTYFGQNMFIDIQRNAADLDHSGALIERAAGNRGDLYLYGFIFSVGVAF